MIGLSQMPRLNARCLPITGLGVMEMVLVRWPVAQWKSVRTVSERPFLFATTFHPL